MALDKPPHWPEMLAAPDESVPPEQRAVHALAVVRQLIVAFHKRDSGGDWRVAHARSDYIVNVVAGLIADAVAIYALYHVTDQQRGPLLERIKQLEDDLLESKRPFTAQMEMQNRRIIALNLEVERLQELLAAKC